MNDLVRMAHVYGTLYVCTDCALAIDGRGNDATREYEDTHGVALYVAGEHVEYSTFPCRTCYTEAVGGRYEVVALRD